MKIYESREGPGKRHLPEYKSRLDVVTILSSTYRRVEAGRVFRKSRLQGPARDLKILNYREGLCTRHLPKFNSRLGAVTILRTTYHRVEAGLLFSEVPLTRARAGLENFQVPRRPWQTPPAQIQVPLRRGNDSL